MDTRIHDIRKAAELFFSGDLKVCRILSSDFVVPTLGRSTRSFPGESCKLLPPFLQVSWVRTALSCFLLLSAVLALWKRYSSSYVPFPLTMSFPIAVFSEALGVMRAVCNLPVLYPFILLPTLAYFCVSVVSKLHTLEDEVQCPALNSDQPHNADGKNYKWFLGP